MVEVNPISSSPEPDDALRQQHFVQYFKERDDYIKAALDAERSYDTLLASISTLALGASFTKDWVNSSSGAGNVFLVFAWFGFASCLILSLLHRYLTYWVHRDWVDKIGQMFKNWTPDIWERIDAEYEKMPRFKTVEQIKTWSGIAVLVGIVMTFCLLLSSRFASAKPPTAPSPIQQTFNIYPRTQPSLKGSP
jgi:hypothetical protein